MRDWGGRTLKRRKASPNGGVSLVDSIRIAIIGGIALGVGDACKDGMKAAIGFLVTHAYTFFSVHHHF